MMSNHTTCYSLRRVSLYWFFDYTTLITMLNLSVILEDSAFRYATSPAFTFMDTTLNYAQVNGAVNQVANGLVAKGIKPGDKVAISGLNLPYFPIIYFGILKAGATVVPLSVLLKQDEIAYLLNYCQAKAYFCSVGTDDLPMARNGHVGLQEALHCEYFFIIMPYPYMPSVLSGSETLGSLMQQQSHFFETVMTGADDTAMIVYTFWQDRPAQGRRVDPLQYTMQQVTHSSLYFRYFTSSPASCNSPRVYTRDCTAYFCPDLMRKQCSA